MMRVGIFYGSTTGNAQRVAELLGKELGAPVFDIGKAKPEELEGFEFLILGTSTWGDGEIEEHWERFFPDLVKADFTGKKVALFGLGDQERYPDTFVDGLKDLYDRVMERGASVIGAWSIEGYTFDRSKARENGRFVGLVIDEDAQPELTAARVKQWVEQLRMELA